ncbi:lethal(3)malignant brain tumor-like protein 3 isoform X2 [Musca domestica]|nr:lethal(3)malignant brain tumor-like protein 3 isoform X2 [Musca domestica]XP_058977006.1 lethal(3)malignant brain tumor-like protein 3 isoform X2 [Musca domestica]
MATTLAPGTTLLKTSLLQGSKSNATPPATLPNKLGNKAMPPIQQQQQQHHSQLQKSSMNTIATNPSSQSILVKCDVQNHPTPAASLISQTVQKLSQVSLLQNSQKSKTGNGGIGHTQDIITKSSSSNRVAATRENLNENSGKAHEIKVGHLSAEVYLIKKPNLSSNQNDHANKTSNKDFNSLLKPPVVAANDSKKIKRDLAPASIKSSNNKSSETMEKQESLLKNNSTKQNVSKLPQNVSPRSQRSQSYTATATTSSITISSANERRHSEPAKLEKIIDWKEKFNSNKKNPNVRPPLKEEYEEEEYLISSGEKSDSNKNSQEQASEPNPETADPGEDDDDDDDVTILPVDDSFTEPIEIDDDDDEEVADDNMKPTAMANSPSPKDKNESLLCDEQILISSSSSISNQSLDSSTKNSPKFERNTTPAAVVSPILKKSLTERKQIVKEEPMSSSSSCSPTNNFSAVLEMLSNFNMLNWRERLGTGRGTSMKFELNEFNLLQLHEKIPTRTKSYAAFEKPVYERDALHVRSEDEGPLTYYTCRKCKVRASALDFLAPEYCSIHCLKRDCRKRQREESVSILRKKQRNAVANVNPPPLAYINQPKFRWSNYLKANYTAMAAPISLFLNPFPTGPNNFKIGMKLEAIDPENCALFCVCTVVDIHGYRLKLSFDGYDNSYDFWLNADSMDIFPPGWCAKTNRILQPPKGISPAKFNWLNYVNKEKALAAPRHLFTHLNSSSLTPRNPFQIGMHLEAEDLNDTGKLCVASVADVLDDRIRIHFDGWDDCYDIIVDINSPYIHPCGWHEGRQQLVVPPDCENAAFSWQTYIRQQGSGLVASEEIFSPREPIHFKPNMKLEVVDPRNSSLIRPATVVAHKGHRVKLHLDGWPNDYCFWLEDDSPDLHPIGWCDATGHELEPPPGFQMGRQKMPCPTPGCRGIGNAKKPFMNVHATRDCCPYVPENWRIVMEKPPRLGYDEIVRTLLKPQNNKGNSHQSLQPRWSDQQILEHLQILDNIKPHSVQMATQEKISPAAKDLIGISLVNVKQEENKCNPSSTCAASINKKTIDLMTPPLQLHLEIAKEFLCDYGPRLQNSYEVWQKNFTFDTSKIKRNPLTWSVSEVGVFVDLYLNCHQTAALFAQEDIDGQAFLLLQQSDLTERLGLKLGPSVKLYACILQLRTLAVTKFKAAYHKASVK